MNRYQMWIVGVVLISGEMFTPMLQASPQTAWWVDARFQPTEVELLGMPVSEFHPSFVRASFLKESDIGENTFWSSGFAFEMSCDLDDDGTAEAVRVGVYEDREGKHGRWFAVVDHESGRIEHVSIFPGEPGFIAVGAVGTDNVVAFCLHCGDVLYIRSNSPDRYFLQDELVSGSDLRNSLND